MIAALPLLLTLLVPVSEPATRPADTTEAGASPWATVAALESERGGERRDAARALLERGEPDVAAGVVDLLFFIPRARRGAATNVLEGILDEKGGDSYWDWVEVIGRRQDITPAPGYAEWKRSLLGRIDPRYTAVFYPGAPARIRLEEIVSGGVPFEGIPAIDDPPLVAAADVGRRLNDDELVFGAVDDGEARAWPRRYLSWHEMLNDEVGGRPVTLSYCTLCGSAVLFDAAAQKGRRTFGTSGLLYRSNKLMVDRESFTLWSNLTGEPVVGRLARGDLRLPLLPLVTTTWGSWRERHPQTTVLLLDDERGWRPEVVYRPGAADRARHGVSFPVWVRSDRLPDDAEVWGMRLDGRARAWPTEALESTGVLNDRVGSVPVVLVVEPEGGGVRTYRRPGTEELERRDADRLRAPDGTLWTMTEEALVGEDGEPGGERLAGHRSFWFGWYSFHPDTEVYTP